MPEPFSEIIGRHVPLVTGVVQVGPNDIDPLDLTRFVTQNPKGISSAGDPMQAAPSTEPSGGIVYFRDRVPAAEIDTLLRLLGVNVAEQNYFVVCRSSNDPARERYLDQLRIIQLAAFPEVFGYRPEPRPDWRDPRLTVGELVHLFLRLQQDRWTEPDRTYSSRLAGTLGGDGDFAREALGFGLMVESTYWGIYRLWSRPWLATK